jgi:hypothetical protein
MSYAYDADPAIDFNNLSVAPRGGKSANKKPFAPQGVAKKREYKPVKVRRLRDNFGTKSTWKLLKESGPLHLHAPVYVPPTQPGTVLKEYPINHKEETIAEAERQRRAEAFMPEVYGVYYDDSSVYIHMQKLKQTVMSKIEEEGLDFVCENVEKFNKLWEDTTLYDRGSMCRVDNMMLTEEDEVKFIDAEKAEEIGTWRATHYEDMFDCFMDSALGAYLKFRALEIFALKKEVNLEEMGRLYAETGERFEGMPREWQFTIEFCNAMTEWFEKYEGIYQELKKKLIEEKQKLRKAFGRGEDNRNRGAVLKTPHTVKTEFLHGKTFQTISFLGLPWSYDKSKWLSERARKENLQRDKGLN